VNLQGYLRIIRKSWWMILLLAALGAGTGQLVNLRSEPTYESTVSFYVSTPTDAAGGNAYTANQYAVAKIQSYIKVLSSDALASRVVAKAQLDMTPQEVANRITASSDLNTVLINTTVQDSSSSRSLAIATALSTEFGPYIDELDNRTSKDGISQGAAVKLLVTSGPTLNATPVTPRTKLNLIFGFGIGLAIGLGLALLRGLMDTTVRSAEALRAISSRPVLGSIPEESGARKRPVLLGDRGRSTRAESFRQLRTNLRFMDVANPVRVVTVTSAVAGEGRSTTAANLAVVSAEMGRRVVLVEADLRRPKLAQYLNLDRAVGLSNVLSGEVALSDALQPWGTDGLAVLPSGPLVANPSELLGSEHMNALLDELRGRFDLIIIDTPPVLPVTDAAITASKSDGVLLVVRYGKTNKTQVENAASTLKTVEARVLGTVFTMRPTKGADAEGDIGTDYLIDETKVNRAHASRRAPARIALQSPATTGAPTAAPAAVAATQVAPKRSEGGIPVGRH
jgi:capsular exopolysaccharide synthesis family protein